MYLKISGTAKDVFLMKMQEAQSAQNSVTWTPKECEMMAKAFEKSPNGQNSTYLRGPSRQVCQQPRLFEGGLRERKALGGKGGEAQQAWMCGRMCHHVKCSMPRDSDQTKGGFFQIQGPPLVSSSWSCRRRSRPLTSSSHYCYSSLLRRCRCFRFVVSSTLSHTDRVLSIASGGVVGSW